MDLDPATLEFLSRLRRLNVQLTSDGGKLRCIAPAGVVTAALRDEMAARKSEILTFLGRASLSTASDPIVPVPREGTLPLSFAQKRLWLLNQLEPANAAYNIPSFFRLQGRLDAYVLSRSLGEIVRRHEVLRSCYLNVDGQPVVKIIPPEPFRLPVVDVQMISPTRQHSEAERLARIEAIKPFRLDRAPLLRATLLKFAPESHVLLLTFAHIAFDGWSFGVLVKELSALYSAGVRQQNSPLPELPIQYVDFAAWQQKILQKEELQAQLEYWKQSLGGSLPVVELPTDRPRPPQRTSNGGSVFFEVPRSVTDDLKALSQRENATLFVTLLAIYGTLLMRYSGQEDLLVGTPVANRVRTEVEPLMGLFVNTLGIRTDFSGDPTCRELIRRIQNAALGAFAHQDVPFEKLVEVLNPERDPSRPALIQTMFSLEQSPVTPLKLPELEPVWPEISSPGAQFDLSLYLTETNHSITGRFSFNSDLFDEATAVRMKDQFETLITEFIRNPGQRVRELRILSDAQRDHLLTAWTRTGDAYPFEAGVHELFEAEARRLPEAIAVECGLERLTYRELNQRSDRLAAHLQTLGAGPDSLIGVCVERSVAMAVALLAILKTGASYLPLDLAFPRERLAFMLEDARPVVLITETSRRHVLPESAAATLFLDRFPWDSEAAQYQSPGHFDRAYVLYTSGSQGRPKGVEVCHRALVNFLTAVRTTVGMDENDIMLSVTTFSFDIFGLELWLPLTSGARTVIAQTETCKDGMLLARAVAASGATWMQATPNTWRVLLESRWEGSARLKILCGGEAWSKQLALRLLPKCAELWNMYGPTETTIWSAAQKIQTDGEVRIGRPIANTQFYVVNASLQLQPEGVPGELLIGGDGLARGYLNHPDLTRERFIANPFAANPDSRVYRTGDLVRSRADGTLEFLSRLDDQVKLRGFRIQLGEIETLLRTSPALKEAEVILRKDGDPRLVAFCVRSAGPATTAAELRKLLAKHLPEYMVPAEYAFLDAMPLTPNGKVDRQALMAIPRTVRERASTAGEAEEAQGELEKQITALWQNVLGVNPVYSSDNFFDLGGHSFTAVQLLSEVQKLTGRRLPLSVLFQAATVKSLAEILRAGGSSEWPLLVPIRPAGSKPPLFLVHGAEGNLLLYRQLVQNLHPDQPVYGLQSQGLDGENSLLTTVEEMAAKYIEEVVAAEPHGPYFVGGYCLGGAIAFEMAQQLTRAGKEVAQVLMFETYNIHASSARNWSPPESLYRLQNIWFHAANVRMLRGAERRRFLREKVETARARFKIRVQALRHTIRNRETPFRSYPHLRVTKVNDEAAARYVPAKYNGRVTLIRPRRYFTGFDSRSFGWEEVIGPGLEVHEIAVYPKGMLVEPFCRSLALLVTQRLVDASVWDVQVRSAPSSEHARISDLAIT